MGINNRNITKDAVEDIFPAPFPDTSTLLEIRQGKVGKLGHEASAIFKQKRQGQQYVSETGITGDEHVYHTHGGIDRALHQYASQHYADWRCEAPHPQLFDNGGFGENLVGTNMTEDNVCIGDLYRIGKDVIVQVSEPRSPCSKLNIRFEWPRALKRVQRTGRVGWNMRVLRTGYIEQGDRMVLVERPNPRWSIINVKRVIQGKTVPLPLLAELSGLDVMTEMMRDLAQGRLEKTPKRYKMTKSHDLTSRVRQFTFSLAEPIDIKRPAFERFAFAKIDFGRDPAFSRSYSIVSGDMKKFSLGVALDDHSRGGSAYLHRNLKIGDEIVMTPGSSPTAKEEEEKCISENLVSNRIVIIGGIGVTAFMPSIKEWEANGDTYEVHYAVRSLEEAPYLDMIPSDKIKVYAKSRGERLCIEDVIPVIESDQQNHTKIYCCGPTRLMDACEQRTKDLGYPEHMQHFESFGGDTVGQRGNPFVADVTDIDSGRKATLDVPADKTLLQVLRDAGFDMTFFCEAGGCGACKVAVCKGEVEYNGTGLKPSEKAGNMLSCVDRGIGRIKIELD